MKFAEVKKEVAQATGQDVKLTSIIINGFLEKIKKALMQGETVTLTGFGVFKVSSRAERQGVNPKTGEVIKIAAHKTPHFTTSEKFRELLN